MNPALGEKKIQLNGEDYTVRFTWKALAAIENKYGDAPDFFNPEVVANILSIAINDSEMTAEKILEMNAPFVPVSLAVQEALQWAYFGKEPILKSDEKKNRRKGGFFRLIRRLF
ncbi:MAG TPA: hypothetical protein PKW17_10415 [Smithellaceae bacterium]|nr:hypothetical protein [Smithellaceae bacterium]HRS90180.1 hypothetical protein [Smithellaceae bacterium]